MKLFDFISRYFDSFEGRYEFLLELHGSKQVSQREIVKANNQFLTDVINCHAHSSLASKFVSVNSDHFNQYMAQLFGDAELVKEIIKVGSNISDYFGYCGFSSDSTKINDGFSLVIDSNSLAFSPNDVRAMSDLVSRNIRFRKAIYKPSHYDPNYQLPCYSMFGVPFHIVPASRIKYPFVEF